MHSPTQDAPYLSVVVAARNDNHADTQINLLQMSVDSWINQAKRHHLSYELILVEWSPLANQESLAAALRWPSGAAPWQVRIIQVPRDTPLPMARNAGIRRARGEFILATNIGVIFSDDLVEFLASGRLEQGRMYRVDRYDIEGEVPAGATPDELLAHCRGHMVRVRAREGTFALTGDGLRSNRQDDITSNQSGISFGEGWFPVERYPVTGEVFRWVHTEAQILAHAGEGGAILALDVEPGPGLGPLPQAMQVIDDQGLQVAEWNLDGRTSVVLAVPPATQENLRTFRLRLPGGGAPRMDDDRILNLAVFRCDWVRHNPPRITGSSILSAIRQHKPTLKRLLGARRKAAGVLPALATGPRIAWRAASLLSRRGNDVFESGLDFQLGPGWFYLEDSGGERFHWASSNAQLFVRMPPNTSRLAILVEPGPGQGSPPLALVVRLENESGKVLAKAPIPGLTYLEFSVPAAPGAIAALHFKAEGNVQPTGSDPRPLGFRLFACGAGTRAVPAPHGSERWPVMILSSKPVTKDWSAAEERTRRQIQEMGKPKYLHSNACGDFTLMARAHWLDLRGYGELDLPSPHLDGLLCYAAHHSGAREEVLPELLRIYRIGHGAGIEDSAEIEPNGLEGIVQSTLHDDLMWLIAQMRILNSPVIFNRDDWGLSAHDLREMSPPAGSPNSRRASTVQRTP